MRRRSREKEEPGAKRPGEQEPSVVAKRPKGLVAKVAEVT